MTTTMRCPGLEADATQPSTPVRPATLELDAPAAVFTPSPELVTGGFIPDPTEWVVGPAKLAAFRGAF